MNFLISLLVGYLIGAIPASYIIVKYFTGKILFQEGSGNVGAMNSYEITHKKYIGIICGIADLLKGIFSVLLIYFLFKDDFLYGLALVATVLGHNFSIFIKFWGGRGLATAAGGLLLINPVWVFLWLLIFYLSKKLVSANVHINNLIATFVSVALVFSLPFELYQYTNAPLFMNYFTFRWILTAIGILIVIKHIQPIRELLASGDFPNNP
ncbi:MAG: glycerol-3-phosphate acyltransferase [Bacteroidota bacterium]